MIVDAAATGIAVIRTNADYAEGRITRVHQLSLNITAGLGFIPGHVGVAFSFINVLITGSGYPR
jgi:hypothetical protein